MYNPSAVPDTHGEWFELTNYSLTETYDLNGWTISDSAGMQSFAIDQSLVIGPRAFLVFARSGDPAANGGIDPDFIYGPALPLSNSGDAILIRAQGGAIVDLVEYDGDVAPAGAALACNTGHSLLNDQAWRWYAATTPYGNGDLGTPGHPNEIYVAGYCAVDVAVLDSAPFYQYRLLPPAPNPGAPPVRVSFHLEGPHDVRLCVYDVTGRLVRVVEQARFGSGAHTCYWDGKTQAGRTAPSGGYWIRLQAGDEAEALPVTLRR
jgi:hypothetical protein